MTAAASLLREKLGLERIAALRPGELVAEADPQRLPEVADAAASCGLRLATLFATDEGPARGFDVHHVWVGGDPAAFVRIVARVPPPDLRFPSVAARHPSANWFEREIADCFGLVPDGHPNPFPVAVHEDWPDGHWVLRKDFDGGRTVARAAGSLHPFRPVTGEGVFHVPVGPVHAGVIEPGHFRFGVAGEPVLYLQLRLFYVHKGTEKRFEGMAPERAVLLAESITGDSSVAHPLAYAHAVERIAEVDVPPRARRLRTVLLEMERLDNHIADIGALATDVAFSVPASRAQVLREGLLAVQEQLFGSRLLRRTIVPGGVRCELAVRGARELRAHLDHLQREFESLVALLIDSGTFTDRVDNTGTLTRQVAHDLGVVGPAGRASGLDLDLRRDMPHDAYADLDFSVPVEDGGDVRARLMVRAREVEQSLHILGQALEEIPGGPSRAPLPARLPAGASALGWAEGWRGECIHWVQTGEAGQVSRVKITDPSFKNWPALARAVPGNILPDFPVINKSFNLSYSGNDR